MSVNEPQQTDSDVTFREVDGWAVLVESGEPNAWIQASFSYDLSEWR